MLLTITISIFVIAGIFLFVFYGLYKANRIDHIMKRKSMWQILLLLLFVVSVYTIICFLYSIFGLDRVNAFTEYLHLFGLFSQAESTSPEVPTTANYIYYLCVYFLGAICFSGILISTISNIFQRRVDAYIKGDVRYSKLSGHDIVIGANELLEPALRHLQFSSENNCNRKPQKVLIVSSLDAESIRSRVNRIGIVDEKDIIIYRGNIYSQKFISELRIRQCRQVVIVGDVPIEECDLGNTNIADLLYETFHPQTNEPSKDGHASVGETNRPLPVFVSFYDDFYFLCFCKEKDTSRIYFYPFNYYELCIANVWGYKRLAVMLNRNKSKENEKIDERYDYFGLSSHSDKAPLYLFLLGFNGMGQEVLKSVIKWAHFKDSDKSATQVYVYTENREAIQKFQRRYPCITNVKDISISYQARSPYTDVTMTFLKENVKSKKRRVYVVICSDNSFDNYLLATHLPVEVYRHNVPVLVQLKEANRTIFNDFRNNNTSFKNVKFFGFYNNSIPFFSGLKFAQDMAFMLANRKNENVKGTPRTRWERFSYDNAKQNRLCHIYGLAILLDELGFEIVKGAEQRTLFPKIEEAKDILQRQFIGWNSIAGYSPTPKPTSPNEWTYRQTNMLFSYNQLRSSGGEGYEKRNQSMENYLNDIILWLKNNGMCLQEIST